MVRTKGRGKRAAAAKVIDLTFSDDDDDDGGKAGSSAGHTLSPAAQADFLANADPLHRPPNGSRASQAEVIVISSSDDDEGDGPPRKRRAIEAKSTSRQQNHVQIKPVPVVVDLAIGAASLRDEPRPPSRGITSEEEVEQAALLITSGPSTPGPSTPRAAPASLFPESEEQSGARASTSRQPPTGPRSLHVNALASGSSSRSETPRAPKAHKQKHRNGQGLTAEQEAEDRKAAAKRERRRAKKAKQRAVQREFEERSEQEVKKTEKMRAFPDFEEERSSRREYDEPRHRRFSPAREPTDLFFVDDTPGLLPSDLAHQAPAPLSTPPPLPHTPPEPAEESDELLLPQHVIIMAGTGADEDGAGDEASSGSEQEEGKEKAEIVEVLPTGRRTGPTRYYEATAIDPTLTCVHCNEQGHIARDCPHTVCFSCGAIDEHDTRQCTIGQLCFNCAKRGHYSRDCPEPRRGRSTGACETCGAPGHRALNCPTIWRTYAYYTVEEKAARDAEADASKGVSILEGGTIECGEGAWCCRCATKGHWADDCKKYPAFRDPTAFGMYNALTGPFAASAALSHDFRDSYDWDGQAGAHGYGDPPSRMLEGVGKMGREKDKAKWKGKEKEYQAQADDDDDWFATRKRPAAPPPRGDTRVWSGRRDGGGDRYADDRRGDDRRGKPSLLQRMDNPPPDPYSHTGGRFRRDDRRYDDSAPSRRNGKGGQSQSYRPPSSRDYADRNRDRDDDDDYYTGRRGAGGRKGGDGGHGRNGGGQKYFGGYAR